MGLHALEVRVEDDAIVYDRAPYRPCSLYPRGVLRPAAIAEVDPTATPPTVLTHAGEFLPVSAVQKEALVAFARRHALPLVQREDVWGPLLDPFLDTVIPPELEAANLRRLAAVGLDERTVARIRRQVARRMEYLTLATWEWVYYGLFDVLDAMEPLRRKASFARFYDQAMAIARRGGTRPWPADD